MTNDERKTWTDNHVRTRSDVGNGPFGLPLDGSPLGRGRRDEVRVWVMRKDVRVMTLWLRTAAGDRWETVFVSDGQLYQTQLFATKTSAQTHVDQYRDALLAVGWCASGR
jgi:hypothetical protein